MRKYSTSLIVGLLILLFGCSANEEVQVPAHRFALASGETGNRAREKIGSELRRVIIGHPSAQIRNHSNAKDMRTLRRLLPESFAGYREALAVPRYVGPRRDLDMPPLVVAIVKNAEGDSVASIDLVPKLDNGLRLEAVDLVAIPLTPKIERLSDEALVPDHAQLEFAFGVLDLSKGRGAVEFSLEVCEAGRCEERFRETHDPELNAGWQDRRISLGRDAGRTISLRLRTSLSNPGPQLFSMPVWTTPILYSTKPRRRGQRNVILISLDTLRADHLTAYGYPHATAPYLSHKFGREGAIFESLVASATTTGPAHMTIFTSLQPSVHGIGTGPERSKLPTAATTLAEQLSRHGFKTGGITENAAIHSSRGFARGFDEFVEDKGGTIQGAKGQIQTTLARGLEWWRRNRDKPFFLFLHTYQTHAPYDPPPGFAELSAAPEPGEASVAADPKFRAYDGEIRFADASVEKFLKSLVAEGMENTIVIITSDHGEEFGEHGFIGHSSTLHAELTHVPLMMYGAGIPAGLRIETPVAQIDLMPTILQFADVPVPSHLMGRNIGEAWAEGSGTRNSSRPIFSETWQAHAVLANGKRIRVEPPTFAVRQGGEKLIRYQGEAEGEYRYEFFDLERDPNEQRSLPLTSNREAQKLKRLADDYFDQMSELRLELLSRSNSDARAVGVMLDPERARKLRALGYID